MTAERGHTLVVTMGQETRLLLLQDVNRTTVLQIPVSKEMDLCKVGGQSIVVTVDHQSLLLQFKTPSDMRSFQQSLNTCNKTEWRKGPAESDVRNWSSPPATTPFDGHNASYLMTPACQFQDCPFQQQQSLLQDYSRITTYQRAILANQEDFTGKVVLDVGSVSGILSFFAVQAGASRVYAAESSQMGKYTQILVNSNCLSERIRVLEGEVDDVGCPDMVDVIVSEPMGYMLLSGKLMASFLCARKWLKPHGLMFPSSGDIHVAPFTDEHLYFERYAQASFWQQRNFYGVNLSALHGPAVEEFINQPIVDTFDFHILMARSVKHCINFKEVKEEDINRIEIPFVFTLLQSGLVHGLAFWFDVAYSGSKSTLWLSTAPTEPLTRWYQVRCLLQTPLYVKMGQTLSGTVRLAANNRQNYNIHITAMVDQSGFKSGNILDLKDPFFRAPSWYHI